MMKLLAGLLATVALGAAADKDMDRAIAWERHKERAAARQAQLEKRHPSVTYTDQNSANRTDESSVANEVKDPGPNSQRIEKDQPAKDKTNKK